jgi:hypothetical protein
MSSKELYFLPTIKEVRLANRPLLTEKLPAFKHKSIEDIIEKKDANTSKNEKMDSFLLPHRDQKIAMNLYNKYESLPKIYMYRNRKQDSKADGGGKVFLKKHLKSEDNE